MTAPGRIIRALLIPAVAFADPSVKREACAQVPAALLRSVTNRLKKAYQPQARGWTLEIAGPRYAPTRVDALLFRAGVGPWRNALPQ